MKSSYIRAVCLLCGLLFAASAFAENPGYRIIKRIPLGGAEGWGALAIDPKGKMMYLARDTRLTVMDIRKERITGDIPGLKGARGIALAPDLKRGFVTNGRSDSVTVFHLKTLKVLGQVKTGDGPGSIVYEPVSKRVFAFNVRGRSATVFDAATGSVVKTIRMVGTPDNGVADGKGRVFVNIADTSEVVELDGARAAVVMRYVLNPGEGPAGIAIDRKNRRVFSGCANRLMAVLDPSTIKVIAAIPIGGGVSDCAFDEKAGLAFSANSEGTLTVVREISPDRFESVQTIGTQVGTSAMALDPRTGNLYLPAARFEPAPAPTPEDPKPQPRQVEDSFTLIVVGK